MKKVNSPTCTFCSLEQETIEHLFFHCIRVKSLWLFIHDEFKQGHISELLPSLKTCIFSGFNNVHYICDVKHVAFNTVLMLAKAYIMMCKIQH